MIKLDLKKFRHVASDDKSTTLQHKDGHTLTIAHKALSPEFQQQLNALSNLPKQAATPLQSKEAQQTMAKGGKMMYAEGSETKVAAPDTRKADASEKPPQQEHDIPANVNTPSSFREAMSRLANPLAQGGEVNPKLEQSKKEPPSIGTLDYNKLRKEKREMNVIEGQKPVMPKRKMYAEGENVVPMRDVPEVSSDVQVPSATDYVTPAPPQAPQDPDAQVYQQALDDAKSRSNALLMNPFTMPLEAYRRFMAPTGMFHPEMPDAQNEDLYFNQKALDAVRIRREKAAEDAAQQSAKQAQIDQVNTQRGQLGLPPMAGTQAPSLSDLPANESPETSEPIPAVGSVKSARTPASASGDLDVVTGQPMQKNAKDAGISDYRGLLQQGLQSERAGAREKAQAMGQISQDTAKAMQDRQQGIAQSQAAYQIAYNELNQERLNHIHDVQQGYVNPEAYWNDHSKIMSGIGMILAGFNPTNHPNAAVDFLKSQLENSIHAQSANLQAKGNLLNANLHQFGNMRDAMDMTRLNMADYLNAQIQQAAAKQGGALADAAAKGAIGEINRTYAPLSMQLAMRQTLMGLAGGGGSPQSVEQAMNYMGAMSPGADKPYRERYLPGFVGTSGPFASNPIPDNVRQQLGAYQNLDNLMNEALAMARKPWTSMSIAERQRGATLMGSLQDAVRQAGDMGVYKESEAHFLDKIMGSNPASAFAALATEPKLQELKKIKHAEMIQKASVFGLRPQNVHPQGPEAARAWALANPRDPRAAKILQRIGQ